MSTNYYEAPSTEIAPTRAARDAGLDLFLTWEKLRLVYNGILLVETVILMAFLPPVGGHKTYLPVTLPLACFTANVCFCLGPVLNFYARWAGLRHPVVTGLIFAAGMLLAAVFTLATVLYWNDSALD